MFERIEISEIQMMLHYKDRRSVRRWCRNNGVRILCDIGSNKQYVLTEELDVVICKIYDSQQHKPETKNNIYETGKDNGYIPTGIYEQSFLNLLQNL